MVALPLKAVIAGLDPAISRRLAADARVKPGHDATEERA